MNKKSMNGEELVMAKNMVNHNIKNILKNYKRMNHKLMKRRMRKKYPYQKHHKREFKRITLKIKL
jgi:hypothetical protein